MATTTAQVKEAFDRIQGPLDVLNVHDVVSYTKLTEDNKGIVHGVGRATFNAATTYDRIVAIIVYEDGTFGIPTSSCVNSAAHIEAYHRAHQFITALGLKETK